MAGLPAAQQLMHQTDNADDVNVEVNTAQCMKNCTQCFTWIFKTGPIKTKVLVIYAFISIIGILALLIVIAHKRSDNTPPYSMPDNMVKELMKVPCQVVNQSQYPPVRKESDDTCFYTKENITKILNATRKSTYKLP
ncbi:Hypothetical predicted protein [Mytilus galloprovincialis]|uniref:Uncharacterized protein n=1 Tax=Mytilus galloprovincialis TaxID=29158 RepID=A0A8B6CH20_MYTGA|nr:Hypothetical predicted protein [Mytilus galloprovincialis]